MILIYLRLDVSIYFLIGRKGNFKRSFLFAKEVTVSFDRIIFCGENYEIQCSSHVCIYIRVYIMSPLYIVVQ